MRAGGSGGSSSDPSVDIAGWKEEDYRRLARYEAARRADLAFDAEVGGDVPSPVDLARWKERDYRKMSHASEISQHIFPRDIPILRPAPSVYIQPATEYVVPTRPFVLKGGPGRPESYAQEAEEGYTEHSYGGPIPKALAILQLLEDVWVWVRDSTSFLDWMVEKGWRLPDAYGGILCHPTENGLSITAVQIDNRTQEMLHVMRVDVRIGEHETTVFPYSEPSLVSERFNDIPPGKIVRIKITPLQISQKATVNIILTSESGCIGGVQQEAIP